MLREDKSRTTSDFQGKTLARPGQELHAHLAGVARRAGHFSSKFQSQAWGELAGWWHDLGKYQEEFQRRLAGERIAVEHSGAGAALSYAKNSRAGLPLAFVIAGHHGGLPNAAGGEGEPGTALIERLRRNKEILDSLRTTLPAEVTGRGLPPLPQFLEGKDDDQSLRNLEFWVRLLFSALTDADFLDTEAAVDSTRTEARGGYEEINTLCSRLEKSIREKSQSAPASLVNQRRVELAEACRQRAGDDPGLFTLTAPTGSGKTLSSMLFALRHCDRWNKDRVIVVLPYTSIIEQNAEEYRNALGAGNVVEHHSNLEEDRVRAREGEEATSRHRLAAENWDAPVIVTTTVQFFESLFGNRPGRCRKLHNISNSVVILDEVQALPANYLAAILDALRLLTDHFGTTLLLSTATPPSLLKHEGLSCGLERAVEIVPDSSAMAGDLKRVRVEWPADSIETGWDELAATIAGERQALAVVHRRQDARELAQKIRERVGEEGLFHLSALMCAAHRSEVLERVRKRLRMGEPCRLVSTQLVEAGVDVDFPVLFRAMAGLDSIVQAAGRCNREGKLQSGRVVVFEAPTPPPAGILRRGQTVMRELLEQYGSTLDPLDPNVCRDYFRRLYFATDLDAKGIQASRKELKFAQVARDFQLIEDGYRETVLVPYGGGRELAVLMARGEVSRSVYRRLQRFTVQVHREQLRRLETMGAAAVLNGSLWTLTVPYEHMYTQEYGLVLEETIVAEPERLVI